MLFPLIKNTCNTCTIVARKLDKETVELSNKLVIPFVIEQSNFLWTPEDLNSWVEAFCLYKKSLMGSMILYSLSRPDNIERKVSERKLLMF